MPIVRDKRHLLLPDHGTAEDFQPKGSGGGKAPPSPVDDRQAHAVRLLEQLTEIRQAAEAVMNRDDLPGTENGVYVAVTGRPGEPLAFDSLDKHGLQLLGAFDRANRQEATLFMPVAAREKLGKLVEEYRTKNWRNTDKPRNQRLVDGIEAFRLAVLRDLWDDEPDLFPAPGCRYRWETWLRPLTLDRFTAEAGRLGIHLGRSPLHFPETDVVLVVATPEQMGALLDRTLCISKVRRSSTTADFFDGLPVPDQGDFVREAADRLVARQPEEARASVCLLDTGVNRGHPLIAPFLAEGDCHAADGDWGEFDTNGHGTRQAGVALFGDLTRHLDHGHPIAPPHRLESVKVVPPAGLPENEYDQLPAITRQAVEWAEMIGHGYRRIYCLATTTSDDTPHDGFPTIWSAELDQLATGTDLPGGEPRLFCVSAGNLRDILPPVADYPALNDDAELESPAQAWNALTIGAYTEKQVLTDPTLDGYRPMAPAGDLCPDSRTASWERTWPIKPELTLEGGNRAVDPRDGLGMAVPDLALLTTSADFPNPFFTTTRATSPATADASRLAAILSDEYPDLWPETIRALLVNSASWTDAMQAYLPAEPKKADFGQLLRRYGYDVPDLDRARRSASNCLTLIVQDTLQPYKWSEENGYAVLNEMKLFELPWPKAALEALEGDVTMRLTLSYFVEPNPSETARGRKLRYASHGLRFKLKLPDEEVDAFRARINKAAAVELGGVAPRDSDSRYWVLGSQERDVGSIHSDIWRGPASDLARCGVIAVHPVGGWWKERAHLERWANSARYSLVVTIDAGDAEVDVYTPVAATVEIY